MKIPNAITLFVAFCYAPSMLADSVTVSRLFHVTNGSCSRNTPFAQITQISTVECLSSCMQQEKCKSADMRNDVGLCCLFQEYYVNAGDLQVNPSCTHYVNYVHSTHPDCRSWFQAGARRSGVYHVFLDSVGSVPVYCVMDVDGGGWIVFQRRYDGKLNFYRNWNEYQAGFGDVSKEHWLGFDVMMAILKQRSTHELRIDLVDYDDVKGYAKYSLFSIAPPKYKLTVAGYTGNIGESLSHHNETFFSTPDMDNDAREDESCARSYFSGWWFTSCLFTNLNGRYEYKKVNTPWGISWHSWKSEYESLKDTRMMFR